MEKVRLGDICSKQSSRLAQKDLENMDGSYPIFGASGLIKKINTYDQKSEYVAVVKDGAGVGRTMLLPAYSSVIGTLQYLIPNDNVNAKYLYYAVKSRHLEKYYTGSAIPHIYFKDYKSEPIILADGIAQRKIALVLERVEKIIEEHKQQLEMLDTLIKARFVEMFGDPIKNDKGWEETTWNEALVIKNGKNQKSVENSNGKYPICGSGGIIGYADKYITQENSVIIGRKGNINRPILMKEKYWNVDTAFGLEPKKEILNIYYLYLYCCFHDFEKLNKTVTIPSLTKKDLLRINMPIPPIILQNQFAEFVEEIDKSKSAIQKSLEKTQTLFDSLMQEYFG